MDVPPPRDESPDLRRERIIRLMAADPRLRVFIRHGRIPVLPARLARRRLLLDVVAQAFEPGIRYPEQAVSSFLATIHDDHAALRRYLADEGFLSRDHGEYWRSAGTLDM